MGQKATRLCLSPLWLILTIQNHTRYKFPQNKTGAETSSTKKNKDTVLHYTFHVLYPKTSSGNA